MVKAQIASIPLSGAKEAAEEGLFSDLIRKSVPQGLKPTLIFVALAARDPEGTPVAP